MLAPGLGNPDFEDLGNNRYRYTFHQFAQDTNGDGGAAGAGTSEIVRNFQQGDIMTCETTVRWESLTIPVGSLGAESASSNYYGEIIRYNVGNGGLKGYQPNPLMPVQTTSDNSMIGGHLTIPSIGDLEEARSFMQATVNMQVENLDDWLFGRRLFHTSVNDGTHFDPSNGSNGANAALTHLNLGLNNRFDDRCSDCHLDNGVNPDRANASNGNTVGNANGYITPRMVGLGLLEAIPNATIEGWAAEDHSAQGVSGTISNVNGYIGRFGWQATQPSIRDQVIAAADGEMGMTSYTAQEVDQLEAYVSLLAVPMARAADLNTHQGYDEFQRLWLWYLSQDRRDYWSS